MRILRHISEASPEQQSTFNPLSFSCGKERVLAIKNKILCVRQNSLSFFAFLISVIIPLGFCVFSAHSAELPLQIDLRNAMARQETVDRLAAHAIEAKRAAEEIARKHRWPIRGEANGRVFELMTIEDGRPLYNVTFNFNGAISTAADLVRNAPPYNVNGAGLTIGIWDGGAVCSTHQEFTGRVFVRDGGMQKSVSMKLTVNEEVQVKAVLQEHDAALRRVLKRISKNQKAIDKLKRETRAILDAIKAA